jgi:hypothetical protein
LLLELAISNQERTAVGRTDINALIFSLGQIEVQCLRAWTK